MPAIMPGSRNLDNLRKFGFRKIWAFAPGTQQYAGQKPNDLGDLYYEHFIKCERYNSAGESTDSCPHFVLDLRAFYF